MSLPTPTVHVPREQNHLAWDPAIPPVASVASGEVIEFDCLDASNGQLTASSTVGDIATLIFDQVDQVNGPVEVRGAEPGDTLQIDLLDFSPADWGWTASIPGFGLLADDFPDPAYKVTALPAGADRAEFWPGIRVPLAPFCGEVGVAPETGPRSTIPPGPPWRQHGHPAPGGGDDPVPPRVRARGAAVHGRWPRHPGRRRGVRDGHRDAHARHRAGDGPQGPAPDRARVRGRARSLGGFRRVVATRPMASVRTSWRRPAAPCAG